MELKEANPGALLLISGYGNGAFRINGVRHEGHLLICPQMSFSWDVIDRQTLLPESFSPLLAEKNKVEFIIVGLGAEALDAGPMGRRLSAVLKVPVEVMSTGAGVRTYNVLALEGRRVGAALWAV